MLEFIVRQFHENQFLTAAIVAAPAAALTYSARALPLRLWQLMKRIVTVEISFNSDIGDYGAIQKFIMERVASARFTRSFLYQAETRWEPYSEKRRVDHQGLTVGYGPHFGFYRRRPVWISRNLVESPGVEKFKERIELTFLTRDRRVVEAFSDEVRIHALRANETGCVTLFMNSEGFWRQVASLPLRPLETVFTVGGQAQRLVDHLANFEASRDWYRRRGLPWHTGVLLTGPPGTGKTSLIHAAASTAGRSLHYLNLGSVEHDRQLTDLVSSGRNWNKSILVIEDADAGGANVSRNAADGDKKPVTLSALLNLLDGLITPDGLVVIATSNHPERLDGALVRAGRFDLQLELGPLGWPEFVAMARLFGHELAIDDARAALFAPAVGATLRSLLLDGGPEAVLR